jgi:toxin YoeB
MENLIGKWATIPINDIKKIEKLVDAILETPFEGIGKPEPLKHNLSGCWSRRIDKEHRLVYEVTENLITVLSMKGHY